MKDLSIPGHLGSGRLVAVDIELYNALKVYPIEHWIAERDRLMWLTYDWCVVPPNRRELYLKLLVALGRKPFDSSLESMVFEFVCRDDDSMSVYRDFLSASKIVFAWCKEREGSLPL